jgi:hypothetical protein
MDIAIILGLIAIIPVLFILYDRYIKQKHTVEIESGNVRFHRIISLSESRNNKLALMLFGLKIINTSTSNVTLKSLELSYGDGKNNKKAEPYLLPTVKVNDKESIVTPWLVPPTPTIEPPWIVPPNDMDYIVLMGDHIWKKICLHNVLIPSEVVIGMAVFILETPIENVDEIKHLSLIIRDYNGNETIHPTEIKDNWKIQLGFRGPLLIDAPIDRETDEKLPTWKGLKIAVNDQGLPQLIKIM